MRKTKRTRSIDYIIMALICLVGFNMGTLAIGYISANENNNFSIKNPIVYLSSLREKTNSIVFKEDKNIIDDNIKEVDSLNHEYISENDIIIEDLEEYESLIIIKDSSGTNSVENIPEPLMLNKVDINKDKPYVLIYHTHGTESYILAKEENYRSSDKDKNMVKIGKVLSTVLEANGHKVDHSETLHDLPSYNQSYTRSLNTIQNKKEKSDNLQILLDIHRDAVLDTSPNIEKIKEKSRIDIDGKSVATFSLVVGPDSPNKENTLNFAKYIKAVSDAIYPGLCKGITIKPYGKYNQHLSDYSALIEIGYHVNTLEEANEGAKLVGEVLSTVLNSIIKD